VTSSANYHPGQVLESRYNGTRIEVVRETRDGGVVVLAAGVTVATTARYLDHTHRPPGDA
jgi:hypothetical protein